PVVQPYLGGNTVSGRYPVNNSRHFASVRGRRVAGLGIIGAVQFRHYAGALIAHHALKFYDIRVSKANFASRAKPMIFFGWVFHEIVAFNIQHSGKWNLSYTHVG